MRKIFVGTLFVFLNFHINLPSSTIGLIPSFIGYYLMLVGLAELTGFSRRFSKIRPVVMIALVYSAIIYVIDLVGASLIASQLQTAALAVVSTALSLFISYNIIMGIKDIEIASGHNLESGPLYAAWWLCAVFLIIGYAVFLVPLLAIFLLVIVFILAMFFLFKFSKTAHLFYAQNFVVIDEPMVMGKRNMILLSAALIIGCAGALVYGRHITIYRTASPCGQLQISYHRGLRTLTRTSNLSHIRGFDQQVYAPVFLWSPCGNYLAINSTDYWNRNNRRAEIINLVGTSFIAPDKHFIQERHEESQTPSFIVHDTIEIEKWLDSENLLFNFSWPYDSYMYMSGWFIWHFPSWTITKLVVSHP